VCMCVFDAGHVTLYTHDWGWPNGLWMGFVVRPIDGYRCY